MLKLFYLLLCTLVTGYRPSCTENSVLQHLRIPTYDFSVRLLDRVSLETDGHFIFSPISTWLQLLAIADGAQGETLNEVLNVSRQYTVCSRQIVRQIFNSIDAELDATIKRRNIFIIDKLLDVKKSFVNSVKVLNSTKVVEANFNSKPSEIKEIIYDDTNDIRPDLDDNDFKMKVLLLADIGSMKANWKSPFIPAYTQEEPFYSDNNVKIGHVNMMNQIGYFKFNLIPEINARAIELPFNDRASMILLEPMTGRAADLFLVMKDTRMALIRRALERNGPKLIDLKMPKFKLTTDIDNVPELLCDMGIEKLFYPALAELKNISDYRLYVSMMMSKYDIEVTETGISASFAPENIIKQKDIIKVSFNKPFVFLVLDNVSDVILYAGIYSKPSVFK